MIILCFDGTCASARVAIIRNNTPVIEKSQEGTEEEWANMELWNSSFLLQSFTNVYRNIFKDLSISINDVDIICYSWVSWYKNSIYITKKFSELIGRKYDIETISIDHITSHYFSCFISVNYSKLSFPILFLSWSGSHNSIALMKSFTDFEIITDFTYFDHKNEQYIWLWLLYRKILYICGFFLEHHTQRDISDVINSISGNSNNELIEILKKNQDSQWIVDIDFISSFWFVKNNYSMLREKFSPEEIYLSYEKYISLELVKKLLWIHKMIPISYLCIVGWISHNTMLFHSISKAFENSKTNVVRPLKKYRWDNASMLWIVEFFQRQYNYKYPSSNIIS